MTISSNKSDKVKIESAISSERTQLFEQVKDKIVGKERLRQSIGVLQEKTVHAVLKNFYEQDEDCHEIPVEGLVADIYNNGNIIEIQTAHFNKLRDKLGRFLPYYDVTVVYPIPATKMLIYFDNETGEITSKRKSPKRGNAYHIFPELYKIKSFLNDEHIHFIITLMDVEEYKVLNCENMNGKRRKSRYGRKKSMRYDRIPVGIVDEVHIERKEDYMQFLPIGLPEEFTTKDLAKEANIHVSLAQVTLNILTYTGNVERIGKKGRNILYKVKEEQ